jgi:hypothetical protein
MRSRDDIDAIRGSVSLLDLAAKYGMQMRRKGRDYWGLSPFKAERTASFKISPDRNQYYCFATAQGGDVFAFVQAIENCDFPAALERLRDWSGIRDDDATQERAEHMRRQRAVMEAAEARAREGKALRAADIWRRGMPAAGTLAEMYLRSRGIDVAALEQVYGWRVPPSLRFIAKHTYRYQDDSGRTSVHPAMIGKAVDIEGKGRGVHQTFLAADGRSKAALPISKLTLGAIWGAGGWLSDPVEDAVIGEGYETTLTVMAALARNGRRIFGVSALALANLAGGKLPGSDDDTEPAPDKPGLLLPECVRRVTLLMDADGKDPANAERLTRRAAAKFAARGIEVSIAAPPLGCDFNDLVEEIAA